MTVGRQLKQKGFTLIELIVVIVILGVLAVTAIPRLMNLSDDARNAATDSVAGAIGSGLHLLYAVCLVATPTDTRCSAEQRAALQNPSVNYKPIQRAAGYVLNASVDTYGAFTLGQETYWFSQMSCAGTPKICTLVLKNKSDTKHSAYIALPQIL